MTLIQRTLGLVSLTLVAACAHQPRSAPSPSGDGIKQDQGAPLQLRVEVRNEHWLPMHLWVEWPHMRHFLGDVAAGGVAVFEIPGDLVTHHGSFRLFADASGSIDHVLTAPIDLRGSHRVDLVLRKVLANSRTRVM